MALITLLATGGLAAGDTAPGPEDPWIGKPSDEIVSVLGAPEKTKKIRGNGRIWTYKLLLLDETSVLDPSLRVVDVPGVGVVGRFDDRPRGVAVETTVEPTTFDKEGRPIGGGPSRTVSNSASWNPDTGELKRSYDPDEPEIATRAGKITVKFTIDDDGHVTEWSVSPKKRAP